MDYEEEFSFCRVLLTDFASFKPILLPAVSEREDMQTCTHNLHSAHLLGSSPPHVSLVSFLLHRIIQPTTRFSLTRLVAAPVMSHRSGLWTTLPTLTAVDSVLLRPWTCLH